MSSPVSEQVMRILQRNRRYDNTLLKWASSTLNFRTASCRFLPVWSKRPPHLSWCLFIWNVINHSHCYRVDLAARGDLPLKTHTYRSACNHVTELPLKSGVTMGKKKRCISLTPLTFQHCIFPTKWRGRNQSGWVSGLETGALCNIDGHWSAQTFTTPLRRCWETLALHGTGLGVDWHVWHTHTPTHTQSL